MTPDTDSNIPELLAIISQIEAKRAANNSNVETACPAQLTAQLLSDDEGEQRLIAYAFALSGNLARRAEERIELACLELERGGYGHDADSLLAIYSDPIFREFERAAREWDRASDALGEYFDAPEADWQAWERASERVRDLATAAGSIAAL